MNLASLRAAITAQASACIQAQIVLDPNFSEEQLTAKLRDQADKLIGLAAAKARIPAILVPLLLPVANNWLRSQAHGIYVAVLERIAKAAMTRGAA